MWIPTPAQTPGIHRNLNTPIMQYLKAELVFSKRRQQEAIVFVGKSKLDVENKTFTQEKSYVWDDEEDFADYREQLGL